MKLLKSMWFDTVITVADLVSKIAYFIPIYTILSAERVVRLFFTLCIRAP